MRIAAALAGVALSWSTTVFGQPSAAPPPAVPSSGKPPLDTVTVTGKRARKEVEREVNEFVFAVLSQIATSVKAPLADEHCKANFYVLVTPQPEALLKQWQARYPRMFDTRNGMGQLRRLLDTPRAVRVWYNVGF